MGNYINKFFPHNNDTNEKEEIRNSSSADEVILEKDSMYTPPIIHKTGPIDPRSITTGIERTPIEVSCTPVGLNRRISAIPKHLQSKPYLETDIDKVMLCLTPKKRFPPIAIDSTKLQFPDMQTKNMEVHLTPVINNKKITPIDKERYDILGIDPRSPAADFNRTPILMPKSIERLKARSRESLHKCGSYEADMFYPKFSYCEMSSRFDVPEIQALPDLAAYAVKSLNLVDGDCNDRSSEFESSCSSYSSKPETTSENGEKSLENQEEVQTISQQNNCNNDAIKIWRDSLIVDKLQESESTELGDKQAVQKEISQVPKEEVIITFDDDSIVKDTPSMKVSKSENDKTKTDTTIKKKKVRSDIKIITDEKRGFNSNDKNESESTKIRTPLGNRSNNGQTLLAKSPQQVFKNKGVTPKMLQENTPPHKKYIVTSKLSGVQWDPDSTVII